MAIRIAALALAAWMLAAAPTAWAQEAEKAKADDGKVHQVKVLTDKAPDFTSRKALVESVTHNAETNDEKAIAIYNVGRFAWYHHHYPREPGGVAALKMLNVYGWGLCGGQHSTLCSLWEAAGFDTRFSSRMTGCPL